MSLLQPVIFYLLWSFRNRCSNQYKWPWALLWLNPKLKAMFLYGFVLCHLFSSWPTRSGKVILTYDLSVMALRWSQNLRISQCPAQTLHQSSTPCVHTWSKNATCCSFYTLNPSCLMLSSCPPPDHFSFFFWMWWLGDWKKHLQDCPNLSPGS